MGKEKRFFSSTVFKERRKRLHELIWERRDREKNMGEEDKQKRRDEAFWKKHADKDPYEDMMKQLDKERINYEKEILKMNKIPSVKAYDKELEKALDDIGNLWLAEKRPISASLCSEYRELIAKVFHFQNLCTLACF